MTTYNNITYTHTTYTNTIYTNTTYTNTTYTNTTYTNTTYDNKTYTNTTYTNTTYTNTTYDNTIYTNTTYIDTTYKVLKNNNHITINSDEQEECQYILNFQVGRGTDQVNNGRTRDKKNFENISEGGGGDGERTGDKKI